MTILPTQSKLPGETEKVPTAQRILIVDDEPAILFAYKRLIEREGIGVDLCECLDTAIDKIKACRYLAVIADMRLAGSDNTDGMEVLRVIREEQPYAQVILSTGYGNKDLEQTARKMGVAYYFEKPVLPSAILDVLKSLNNPA
jgi:two-component system response regulator PilR (NtrC family)